MSQPRTEAPLPSIANLFEESQQSHRDYFSYPQARNSYNLLLPSLGSPYLSPPMSRRSSVKPNLGTSGQESAIAPLSTPGTLGAASSSSRSLPALQQQQQREEQQQQQQQQDAAAGDSTHRQSPGAAVAVSSQPSPTVPFAPTGHASSSSALRKAGAQQSSAPAKTRALQFFQFQVPSQPSSASDALGTRSSRSNRNVKQHVLAACSNCKKAHLSCDEARPCGRCITKGLENSCVDVQHKKRGRPRTRPSDFLPEEDSSPATSTQQSPVQAESQESSPIASNAMQQQRLTKASEPFELGSSTASVTSTIPSAVPTAFLDMDFHIARTNEPFRQLFGFMGELEDKPLDSLVDPNFAGALRQLRVVLLEERDTRNSPRLPPIRSIEDPRVGEIPSVESQDFAVICRGQVPRQERWSFRTAEGGTRALAIQLCLARTDVFFLSLAIYTGGEHNVQKESPLVSDKTLSPTSAPAHYLQTTFPAQPSSYPPLRRSRRYSRPLSSYIEPTSQAPPATTVTSTPSVYTSLYAPTVSSLSPASPYSIGSTGAGATPRLPPSPSIQMPPPRDAGHRRSSGSANPSSSTPNRRRNPPTSWSYQVIEIPDPSALYAQPYVPDYHTSSVSQAQLYRPMPSVPTSAPPQSRVDQFQLPPIQNPRVYLPPPPPPLPTSRPSAAPSNPSEMTSAESTSSITPLQRQESKKERATRRASAREQREQEHEAQTYEHKRPSSSAGQQPTSASERPPSRKRAIDDV